MAKKHARRLVNDHGAVFLMTERQYQEMLRAGLGGDGGAMPGKRLGEVSFSTDDATPDDYREALAKCQKLEGDSAADDAEDLL